MIKELKININTIFIAIAISSCTDQGSAEDVTYGIENTLEMQVTLKFYNRIPDGIPSLAYQESIDGQGLIVERTLENVSFNDVAVPLTVFEADSLAIIFEGDIVEGHRFSPLSPEINSIYDVSSPNYENRVYRINQINLNNAVPCNGSCN